MFEKAHIRLSKEICNYDSSFPLKINSSLRFSSFKLCMYENVTCLLPYPQKYIKRGTKWKAKMKWENQISSRKRKKEVKKLKSNDRSFENVLSNASIIGGQFQRH